MTFDDAYALVEEAVTGSFRHDVVAEAARATEARVALERIREQMRSHRWIGRGTRVALDDVVSDYDDRTRRDGLHVLHDWDGKADHINPETIPVDVATYLAERATAERPDPRTLAILVDYYFLYMLALLAVRLWDRGDADANFDRLDILVDRLQGPDGSGERFISDSETLLLIAGSHYERHERVYDDLLARVRELSVARRRQIAIAHAAGLGSHLRFGLEATYQGDIGLMREDNRADYPWLCFSLATLLETWRERRQSANVAEARIVEAIANGLSADPDAFLTAHTPSVLAANVAERRTVRDAIGAGAAALAEQFAPHRPIDGVYCPLAFFFNFSQNVLKGTVVDATVWGDPRHLTVNDLLTGFPRNPEQDRRKLRLLDTLMAFARRSPDRIRGRLVPVIVYDVVAGRRAFGAMARAMRDVFGQTVG